MGDRIPVLLLGNKLDNEKEREVPRGLGEQLAKVKSPNSPLSRQGGDPPQHSGVSPRALGGAYRSPVEGRQLSRWVSGHLGSGACTTAQRGVDMRRG